MSDQPSDRHPVSTAVRMGAHFKNGALVASSLRAELEPVCNAMESFYFGSMPWKVRLYVLCHGRVPFSYQEVSDDN